MATFTMALWRAIDLAEDGNIGLGKYPIFDESYREQLNKKIIDHYHDHEIGMETIDMFRLAMSRRMNEIMPYWNQMYESQRLKIDPLNTIAIESLSEGKSDQATTSEGVSGSESISDSKGRTINQSFPQSALASNKDYAESGADTRQRAGAKSEAKEDTKGTTANTDENKSSTKGFQGSQAMLLMQYRATFLNIDLEIIDALPDLFMSVWNNGDFYTGSNRRGYIY